ncbi:hypothetical protein [Corynebacterium sp. CCM 9203]|uniref:hypothetical protein n=1 Tax=Corynebacterium sp. CCM 9203 TaxID=3057615 RepID=UPI0035243BAD
MTILHSGRPDLPGFDSHGGVYSNPEWCAFVDSDDPTMEPAYFSDAAGTFLIAHYCPAEPPPHYPRGLVFGGRGGCTSRLLLADGTSAERISDLISAAVDMFPDSRGAWSWPFLPGDDSGRLIRALGISASQLRLAGADCTVRVTPGGVEAHIADALQSRERREDVRSELTEFAKGPVRISATPGTDPASPSPDVLAPLFHAVERAHGHPITELRALELLRRRHEFLARSTTVFTATDPAGTVTGFSVLRHVGDEATVDIVGLADPTYDSAAGPLYSHLAFWAPLEWCATQDNRIHTLHLGMQAFEAKTRRGAAMRSLWTVTVPAENIC